MRYIVAIIIAAAFCAGFILLKPRIVLMYVKHFDQPTEEQFCSPPDGYCLVRGEGITATQLESWRNDISKQHPNACFALFSLGLYHTYKRNAPAEGAEYFDRVCREYPSHRLSSAALFESGVSRMMTADSQTGIRAMELFCSKYPSSWRIPAAYMFMAMCYRNSGDCERAASMLEKIIKEHPHSPQNQRALKLAMDIYREMGRHDEGAKLSLLVADNTRSHTCKAEALVNWLQAKSAQDGADAALAELAFYLPVIKGSDARSKVLRAASELAYASGLEEKELDTVSELLTVVPEAEKPDLLWRKYELEASLGNSGAAKDTLSVLVDAHSSSPAGKRAEDKLSEILSAGMVR